MFTQGVRVPEGFSGWEEGRLHSYAWCCKLRVSMCFQALLPSSPGLTSDSIQQPASLRKAGLWSETPRLQEQALVFLDCSLYLRIKNRASNVFPTGGLSYPS